MLVKEKFSMNTVLVINILKDKTPPEIKSSQGIHIEIKMFIL